MPEKKKVVKKAAKKVVKEIYKHILVSFLGQDATPVSVAKGMTLSAFFEMKGWNSDDYKEIVGIKAGKNTTVKAGDIIDGIDEIILVPNGGGGSDDEEPKDEE